MEEALASYQKATLDQRIWWALGIHGKHNEELFDWRNMDPPMTSEMSKDTRDMICPPLGSI